jgi:hypothetical protein
MPEGAGAVWLMAMKGVNKNKQASRVFIELNQSYLFHILTAAK